MKPVDVRHVGKDEILITWDDQHRSLYGHRYLRMHCPCAGCMDEWSGKRILIEGNVATDIRLRSREDVGSYALKFIWSDGHKTGIFAFDYLRKICPCSKCTK